MRVAYTIEQCWHRVPGGTAVAMLELARALAQRPELDLVGVAARHGRPAPPAFAPPMRVAHLPLARRPLYAAWSWARWPAVERATGRVDVVHATTIVVPPAHAPIVVTVHDLAFVDDARHFTRRGARLFRRGLALVRRHAALVACPSDATREACVRAGIDPSRLRVVPWGVHRRHVSSDEADRVRARYGLHRPYLLFVGTLEPRKNLARLFEAFGLLGTDHRLVVAGPSGWGAKGAPDPELARRVDWLGFVPPDELPAIYAAADVFCYPSLREGFGLPILEAMAQGTPVVTSRGSATGEVARDAAVLVDPEDPAAIARGIETALACREEYARRGRRRAEEYTWERSASLMARVYEEACAR